jgi:Ca-activated chloride channel family protein
MLKRLFWGAVSLASVCALVSLSVVRTAQAQWPSGPSQPKPATKQPATQQPATRQKDPKEKTGAQRQQAQTDNSAPSVAPPSAAADPVTASDERITIGTDMVNLDVTVIDQNNNPVFNLKKEDFSVYEDKVRQSVENVIRQELPISIGLVIDTSGSMGSKIETVTDSAALMIKQMKQDDEAFIASFKNTPELVQDFTGDKKKLEGALGELFTSGGTALLDAIIATADYAQEKGKRRRKALVVITDGLEKNSAAKEKELMDAIKEDEVQVYLVGFVDEGRGNKYAPSNSSNSAKDLLTRIADDSGGRAFFPKDVSEIPAIAAQISNDLRTQYVVSYYSSNDNQDGSFRSVQVAVNYVGGRKLIARARRGYYARDGQGLLPATLRKKSRGK